MSSSCCHFSACPRRMKEKEFHCPQGGSERLFSKTTLVWPCISVHVVIEQMSSWCGCERKVRIKLLALKRHFESEEGLQCLEVNIRSKIHDQNPRRPLGETCCLECNFQRNPKYGCKDTATACFAHTALVAWKHLFDSTLRKFSVHSKYVLWLKLYGSSTFPLIALIALGGLFAQYSGDSPNSGFHSKIPGFGLQAAFPTPIPLPVKYRRWRWTTKKLRCCSSRLRLLSSLSHLLFYFLCLLIFSSSSSLPPHLHLSLSLPPPLACPLPLLLAFQLPPPPQSYPTGIWVHLPESLQPRSSDTSFRDLPHSLILVLIVLLVLLLHPLLLQFLRIGGQMTPSIASPGLHRVHSECWHVGVSGSSQTLIGSVKDSSS